MFSHSGHRYFVEKDTKNRFCFSTITLQTERERESVREKEKEREREREERREQRERETFFNICFKVWNESEERIVLIVDFLHPDLTDDQRKSLKPLLNQNLIKSGWPSKNKRKKGH